MTREEILRLLRERMASFAASHIGGDVAEDLAQEVLLVLHEKYGHVTALEELLPLSFQIMRFKMQALRRKTYRRGEHDAIGLDDIPLPDRSPDPETLTERRELQDRLQKALASLGERCRELFRLKLQGRTFPEIQERLGAGSINTIYTWDARCRQQLQELMGTNKQERRR